MSLAGQSPGPSASIFDAACAQDNDSNDEDDDGVVWMTDTSAEAAKRRAEVGCERTFILSGARHTVPGVLHAICYNLFIILECFSHLGTCLHVNASGCFSSPHLGMTMCTHSLLRLLVG